MSSSLLNDLHLEDELEVEDSIVVYQITLQLVGRVLSENMLNNFYLCISCHWDLLDDNNRTENDMRGCPKIDEKTGKQFDSSYSVKMEIGCVFII